MERTRYILAGWLIDGSGGPAQKRMLLTIVNGRFAVIDRYIKDNAPDPSLVTDLSHCTIVPPLVDCHVHLASSPSVNLNVLLINKMPLIDRIKKEKGAKICSYLLALVRKNRFGQGQHICLEFLKDLISRHRNNCLTGCNRM
jgi:hypothetical protein